MLENLINVVASTYIRHWRGGDARLDSFQIGFCCVLAMGFCFAPLFLGCSGSTNSNAIPDESSKEVAKPKLDLNLAFDLNATDPIGTDSVLPSFTDVADERGLNFQYHSDEASGNFYFPEVFGAGVACFDFDLDGWCDLYLPNGQRLLAEETNRKNHDALFRNRVGQFKNVSEAARISGFQYSHGCSYGDVNCDGFEDVLVANFGTSELFLNQGDGTFVQAEIPLLKQNSSWWMVASLADLDADGWVDILLLPYVDWDANGPLSRQKNGPGYPGPNEFDSLPILALQNLGDGNWSDGTSEWGFGRESKAMAVAVVDFDDDLLCEVYIANDGTANQLFTRSRNLQFNPNLTNASRVTNGRIETGEIEDEDRPFWKEIGEISGTASGINGGTESSMSATVADFDLNGQADLLVTNYFGRSNSLYANRGQLNFRNISYSSRMDAVGQMVLSFGATPVDYDLDGDWDIVLANGHVLGKNAVVYQQAAQFLRNVDGAFIDISSVCGEFFQLKTLGRSVAAIDFDRDGDTDLIVTHTDRPVSLLENRTERQNQWISLCVMDPRHRSLAGGRIVISAEGKNRMTLPIVVGGSYLSDSQKSWTVGLGKATSVELTIHWPDGKVDHWENISANHSYRLLPKSPPLVE